MKRNPKQEAIASILAFILSVSFMLTALRFVDPGPPAGLKFRPVPPSCCGDSICLMEGHHGF